MPVGHQGSPMGIATLKLEGEMRKSAHAALLAQAFAINYGRSQDQFYLENRITPWYGLAAPLWTRYTEVLVGRRPWYHYDGYGPYDTIPAKDDHDRQYTYFRERDISLGNGFTFKSLMLGSDGVYNRNIDIDFSIKCGAKEDPDTAEVTIYNVNPDIIYLFDDAPIIVRSGYSQCYDTMFTGVVDVTEPKYEDSGAAIKVKAVSDFRAFMGKRSTSVTYPNGTKYMTIINDLLAMVPFPIGYVHPTDRTTEEPLVFDKDHTIKHFFDVLSARLGYTYTYQGGKFYFMPMTGTSWGGYYFAGAPNFAPVPLIHMDVRTGLLSIEKQTDDEDIKYSVVALLLPHYSIGAILDIRSARFGHLELKVKEIDFRSDEKSHYAIMLCEIAFPISLEP